MAKVKNGVLIPRSAAGVSTDRTSPAANEVAVMLDEKLDVPKVMVPMEDPFFFTVHTKFPLGAVT
jgi:hypothetical protein